MVRLISLKAPAVLLSVILSFFILSAARRDACLLHAACSMLEEFSLAYGPASILYPPRNRDFPGLRGRLADDLPVTTGCEPPSTPPWQNRGNVLSFSHLTYVDVYLFSDSGLVVHKAAGAFRPRSEIADGDGRLYMILPIQAGKDYTLLIQVHHTKHYQPVFDFQLQPRRQFSQAIRTRESFDAALLGAVVLLLIYTLLSWAVSRHRPYAWLAIFIAGLGLYVFSSGGYWIDWFSPEDPASGWLLNAHFLHAGMFGLYLLVTDAWRIRTAFPRLYAWIRWIPWLIGATTITTFCIDYWSGNYNLSAIINCLEHPLMMGFVIATLYICWSRLSAAQRFLGYGLALCGIAGMFITANILLNHERLSGQPLPSSA